MINLKTYQTASIILALCVLSFGPVSAHFEIGTTYRYFIVTETQDTTEIYVRSPIALIFGDILTGATDEHSFLVNRGSHSSPQFFLSRQNVKISHAAFTTRLANSLSWKIREDTISSRIRDYRILDREPELQLLTSSAARLSLESPSIQTDVAIGTGYIDMLISVPKAPNHASLAVKNGLPKIELPDDVIIQNKVVDERDNNNRVQYTRQGQLTRPLAFPRSLAAQLGEYIYQGILHIFIGIDHVLLIIAITLGGKHVWKLIGTVTAFTFGHAITLAAGFFNLVPQGTWFIPLVEAAIAATLILAAAFSFLKRQDSFLIYTIVGLLHGLGFSFVLSNVLQTDSSNLTPALLSFMVGIELAQIFIVLAVLTLFFLLRRAHPEISKKIRIITLLIVACIGTTMLIQRFPLIF